MIGVVLVMFEQITIIRQGYKLNSFNMDVFQMSLNAVVPYGKSKFFSKNVLNLSASGARHFCKLLPDFEGKKMRIFFGFMWIQIAMAVVFRAALGMFVILSMRYKMSAKNFVVGFWIYMTDIFSGTFYIVGVIFSTEHWDERRFAYALVNASLLVFEMYCGIDIIAIRVIMWFMDRYIFMTMYSIMPKYLRVDMSNAEFPQQGSHPWLAIGKISDLAKHVVKVVVEDENGKVFRGLGFLRRDGRRSFLMSVAHVVEKSVRLRYNDTVIADPQPALVGGGDDPVTSIVTGNPNLGADVRILDSSEIGLVDSMFFIKMGDEDESVISWVSKFSYDKDGDIRASVDLSRGDSGGPAFAVLGEDVIRYAGCVSAGESGGLSGNWISSVCSKTAVPRCAMESDSDSFGSVHEKKVTFESIKDESDVRARVTVLNKRVQSFSDSVAAYWFVDPENEGSEAIWFETIDDIVAHIEGLGRDDFEKESEKWKKKGKKKGRTFDGVKSWTFDSLRNIHSQAVALLGESLGERFIIDVRSGCKPQLYLDKNRVTFVPMTKSSVPMARFNYYKET
jgi:hypothetical protein